MNYHDRTRAIAVPFARTEHMAVRLNGGRVLFVGGRDESKMIARQLYVFDSTSEAFTAFGSIVTSGPFGSAAVRLADGNVLLVGGIPATAFSNAVLINAQTGAVTPASGQPHSRRVWGTGTRLADCKVLFVGGLLATGDDGNAIEISTTADPTAEIYDPTTGAFTALPAALSVGFVQHELAQIGQNKRAAALIAVGVAAVLFGLAHFAGGWPYVIAAAAAGVGYGWAYHRTQRVEAAMAVHFAVNAAMRRTRGKLSEPNQVTPRSHSRSSGSCTESSAR